MPNTDQTSMLDDFSISFMIYHSFLGNSRLISPKNNRLPIPQTTNIASGNRTRNRAA